MILNNIYYIWIGIGSGCSDLNAQAIGVPFPFSIANQIIIAMNQEKKCTKCGISKPFSEFYKDRKKKDELKSSCKTCELTRINIKKQRSKVGLISTMYNKQRGNSKLRGHEMPDYTKQELIFWCLSKIKFHLLYNAWVESGYDKNLIPSGDRTDDSKGYSLSRLQLMTWQENSLKANSDMKAGKLINVHKSVECIHLISGKENLFVSAKEAQRETGVLAVSISRCCNGKRGIKQAGGYKWKFAEATL